MTGYSFPDGACEAAGAKYLHPYSAACNFVILAYLALLLARRRWHICRTHVLFILCQLTFEAVHFLCHLYRGALGGYCFAAIHVAGLGMTTTFAIVVDVPRWMYLSYVCSDVALFAIGALPHVHALFIFLHIAMFAGAAALRGVPLRRATVFIVATGAYYAVDSMFCQTLVSWSNVFPWHVLVELGGFFVFLSVNESLLHAGLGARWEGPLSAGKAR